jgi:hypothetical protein
MSDNKTMIAVGTFTRASDARAAIESLRAADFADDSIGILTHDKDGDPEMKSFKDMAGDRAGTGAAVGAAAGAGGGALWAVGIAAGVLPAIGPIIAGGILAAIAVSAAAGAAAGGLAGTMIGMGISDEEAAYYDAEFKDGKTIVVVESRDRAIEAYRVLQGHNTANKFASRYI